jgi:hypothetical protein
MINYAYLDIHNCLSLNQNISIFNSESEESRSNPFYEVKWGNFIKS